MNEQQESLGQAIDRLDSTAHALLMNIPAETHVKALRAIMPEIVQDLKSAFTELTGENPWG